MISVSFYLLNPKAKTYSQVYASISNRNNRLRFATGEKFLVEYCNIRKKGYEKVKNELVRRSTVMYFEYDKKLRDIRDQLIRIEMELSREEENPSLNRIRDEFYLQSGKVAANDQKTFFEAYSDFVQANLNSWSESTYKIFNSIKNHLKAFEESRGSLHLVEVNEDLWNALRDDYFVKHKKFGNNTTNKYLRAIKQFIRYSIKRGYIKHKINLDDLNYLTEIEPFKIALKSHEVRAIMNLDLSNQLRLDKVRDLFILEVMTAQRFSDVGKVLDKRHISENSITFYQQKTDEKAAIPIHPDLRSFLNHIFKKYPSDLPKISNQKFNQYIKEIGKIAGINREHAWITLSGKKKVHHSDFRYNLIGSHTGRRTFCTLANKSKIDSEVIMKVTGHKSYAQFRSYIKVDDEDVEEAFEGRLL